MMNIMRGFRERPLMRLVLLCLSLSAANMANAQPVSDPDSDEGAAITADQRSHTPCINGMDAEALTIYSLPNLLTTARNNCSGILPSGARLMNPDPAKTAEYRAAADAGWPDAKRVINKIAANRLPTGMSDDFLRPMTDALVSGLIAQKLKPENCGLIDKLYTDLEPLPPRNLASFTVTLMQLAAKESADSKFPICQAPSTWSNGG